MNREYKYRARQTHTGDWHYFFFKTLWFLGEQSAFYSDWGEWTGLRDKNGKEIYEGDLMRAPHDGNEPRGIWKIQWNNAGAEFESERTDGKAIAFLVYTEYEVIGNIYENPELLSNPQ